MYIYPFISYYIYLSLSRLPSPSQIIVISIRQVTSAAGDQPGLASSLSGAPYIGNLMYWDMTFHILDNHHPNWRTHIKCEWMVGPYIGNVIIPTDELHIFFRGASQPPTRTKTGLWLPLMNWYYLVASQRSKICPGYSRIFRKLIVHVPNFSMLGSLHADIRHTCPPNIGILTNSKGMGMYRLGESKLWICDIFGSKLRCPGFSGQTAFKSCSMNPPYFSWNHSFRPILPWMFTRGWSPTTPSCE